jgi:hypothetical protein
MPAEAPAGFDLGSLTSVGGSPISFLSHVPAQFQGAYISGFHQAFSIAIADSVWVGVGAAALSFLAVLALKEKPLRAHFHAEAHERSGLAPAASTPAASATPASAPPAGSSAAGAAE